LYSTLVPSRYIDTAVRALNNPDTFTNRQQVALMDARAGELFEQLSKGGHGDQSADALMLAKQIRTQSKDKGGQRAQLDQLIAVLQAGVADRAVWDELTKLWDDRRRAIDTDSKVQYRQRIAMSQEQAAALAAIVIQAAFEFIPDEEKRREFADRVQAGSPGGVRALVRSNNEEGK